MTKLRRAVRCNGDEFEHKGLTFRIEIEHDDSTGAPWVEHDGHGVVTDWTSRPKMPGERVLNQDRGSYRYYDVTATLEIAKRDGWGLSDDAREELARKLKRQPTKREIIAAAVDRDYELLRRWCNDDWHWCGVVVTLLDIDGCETDETESLWGIESDAYDYHQEVARELAEDIARKIGRRKRLVGQQVRA